MTSSTPNDDHVSDHLLNGMDRMSLLHQTDYPTLEAYHTARLEEQRQHANEVQERAQLILRAAVDTYDAQLLKAKADALERSVKAAEKKAKEEIRIREAENRAKQIPQPPPKAPSPPPPPPAVQSTPPAPAQAKRPKESAPPRPSPPPTQANPSTTPESTPKLRNPFSKNSSAAVQPPQPSSSSSAPPTSRPGLFQKATQPPQAGAHKLLGTAPTNSASTHAAESQSSPAPTHKAASTPTALVNGSRFTQIFKDCKALRKYVMSQDQTTMNLPNIATPAAGTRAYSVKTLAGDLRRMMSRTLGQLTDGTGTNKEQVLTVRKIFDLTLNQAPSPLISPEKFFVEVPAGSVEGGHNNGPQLPCLFIYMVNIFAKAIINQMSSEVAVNPRIAEPIGVLAHTIITSPEYLWRGKPFVDIIMAKLYVSLPVVFGIRGNEATQEGRARLGWKRSDGEWISEGDHYDRMRGLGAGYAALCLRNYTRSKRENPWPPFHYWNSMALLLATPPGERSATPTLVLTAMIDGFEEKFLEFYGDMAIAALRAALITFPRESTDQNPAIKTLMVLGERLKRDMGLAI